MTALASHADALRASLSKANLLGPSGSAADLIPAGFQPATQLDISFGADKKVSLGTFVRAGEAKPTPSISFSTLPEGQQQREDGAAASKTFLFMMIDPDAPTPADPKFAYWRHYVISGLRPSGEEGKGETLTEYLSPGPGEQSAPHRYLFLLFEEPTGGLHLTKEDVGGEEFVQRRSFRAAEFVARHGLKLAGVNWMTCAWDGYTE